jgi:hypothetical protein
MNFWSYLSNTANIIQILSAIPLFAGAWLLFNRSRRYKQKMKETEMGITAKPIALAISVMPVDISTQVKDYLTEKQLKMEVRTYWQKEGITPDNIVHRVEDIAKIKAELSVEGVTEVHLFLMTPVAFASFIGAIFDNWVKVKVYHHDTTTGKYEFWGFLHKAFIPQIEYSPVKEFTKLQ